jgi:hypothetical protein
MDFRLLGRMDVVMLIGALLLFVSAAVSMASWEERWFQSIGAFLWICGLSTLALGVVGRLG